MTFKKFLLSAFSIYSVFCFSGCASIVSRSEYPVVISTNAPEATVVVRNPSTGLMLSQGPAPLSVSLSSGAGFFQSASYLCEVKNKENKIQVRSLNASFDPWFIGNFFIPFGLWGMIIDAATGAMFRLDDNVYVHFSEYSK